MPEEPAAFPSSPNIRAIAALDDDLRRGMYEFARSAGRPVTREEAAAAVGISRKLAAFHLDKLVTAGLLGAHTRPVGGIRKVGRTPKVYEPVDTDIQVTIPARRHQLLAEILIDAVRDEGVDQPAPAVALRIAGCRGRDLGDQERTRLRAGRVGTERALAVAEVVLARHGFEPARDEPGRMRLRNCPFHPLAAKAPELVCALNQAYLAGFLTGLHAPTVRAVLVPTVGECCVHLVATTDRTRRCDLAAVTGDHPAPPVTGGVRRRGRLP